MLPLIATAAAALFFLGRKVVRRKGRARKNPGTYAKHSLAQLRVQLHRLEKTAATIVHLHLPAKRLRTLNKNIRELRAELRARNYPPLPLRTARGNPRRKAKRTSKRKSPRKARRTSKGWVRTTTVTRVTKLVRKNPHLLRRGKKPLQIRNMGWLLSHSDDVERFTVTPYRGKSYIDGILTARMRDGSRYRTTYASKSILWTFLQRPKFIGLPIRWFGKDMVIVKGATRPNPTRCSSKRKSRRH